MVALASPAELRLFVQNPELPEDASSIALEGISELVRNFTGRAFAVEEEAAVLDGTGSYSLLLPKLPVLDVTEVLEAPGDETYEWELVAGTHFEWSADGRLRRIDGAQWLNRLRYYRVTYNHGQAVPADVKLLVLRVAARAIVNPEGLTQENAAGYGSTFGFDASRLAVLSDPDKEALAPYRVTV